MLQTAHFFDSFFLKVPIDLFSQNLYIPIKNQQGGGADISSFLRKKAWGQEKTFVKYRQSEAPRPQTFYLMGSYLMGSPIKRHLSREKAIPTVRGVSSSLFRRSYRSKRNKSGVWQEYGVRLWIIEFHTTLPSFYSSVAPIGYLFALVSPSPSLKCLMSRDLG